jgi:hypothetical protein
MEPPATQVTKPTDEELAQIEAQRDWVRGHYEPDTRHKYQTIDGKLVLLQAILDAGWIDKSETVKLQCLGVALGDALAQELHMEWITVEDEYGRDPALRLPGTTIMVFPLTMISKRIEDGESVNVEELFEGVCEHVAELRKNPELRHN